MSDILNESPTSPDGGQENSGSESSPAVTGGPEIAAARDMERTREMAATYERVQKARTEKGQFASSRPASPSQASQASHTDPQTGQPAQEAPQEEAAPIGPNSWRADMRAKFGMLPPDIQQYIAQREQEAHAKITELGTHAKLASEVKTVADHFRPALGGMSESVAFAHLLAAHNALLENPVEAIRYLADSVGVDLSGLGSPSPAEPADETAYLNHLVESFAADKQEIWPLIQQDLIEQMHGLRLSNPNMPPHKVLETAYARAVKVNEGVANRLNEAKRKEAEAKAESEKKRKADEAKKHASLNVKSNSGGSPKPSGKWEDTMREVANRVMG